MWRQLAYDYGTRQLVGAAESFEAVFRLMGGGFRACGMTCVSQTLWHV